MKKIPSPKVIAEMSREYRTSSEMTVEKAFEKYSPHLKEEFDMWDIDYTIESDPNLSLFENFFKWLDEYQLSQTPLYKALNEK